jgi:hypothetical protein
MFWAQTVAPGAPGSVCNDGQPAGNGCYRIQCITGNYSSLPQGGVKSMLSFGGGCPWASTTCTFDHGEPAVSILESVPYWLRFTYVTPVLITKLRVETPGQLFAEHGGSGPSMAGYRERAIRFYEQSGWRTAGARAFPSCMGSISTEIYLCHACPCHEISRMETPGDRPGR